MVIEYIKRIEKHQKNVKNLKFKKSVNSNSTNLRIGGQPIFRHGKFCSIFTRIICPIKRSFS